MRTTTALALLLAASTAAPLSAQGAPPSGGVATSRALWEQITGYITTAAEELPEATYGFKPTPEVRSFGQLIGHIAGAQNLICAAALGEPARSEDEIEKSQTTKAGLVAALKASTEYCARAYRQTDAQAAAAAQLFGMNQTRMYALMLNATHNGEHYGNIVTYLRMNKIVPPSSRQGM